MILFDALEIRKRFAPQMKDIGWFEIRDDNLAPADPVQQVRVFALPHGAC